MLCALLTFLGSAHADNFTAAPLTIGAGDEATLTVGITGFEVQPTAWQFVLSLPDGIRLVEDSPGKYAITLSDRHDASSHSLTVTPQADGTFMLVCYSAQNSVLSGGDGALVSLKLRAAARLAGQTLSASITSGSESDRFGNVTSVGDRTFDIVVANNNALVCPTVALGAGEDAAVEVSLNNENKFVTAWQMQLSLPDGVSLAQDNKGQYLCTLSDRHDASSHQLTVTPLATKGSYQFVCYSGANTILTGHSGTVLNMTLRGAANLAGQGLRGHFSQIGVSTIYGDVLSLADVEFTIGLNMPIVTPVNVSRVYGDENPEFSYTTSGSILFGEPQLTTVANITSPVGTYPITVSRGSIQNVDYDAVEGMLTILPAPLTISVEPATKKQGDPLPKFTATYSGFKNGETSDVLSVLPTLTTTATEGSEPGTYDITPSGAEAQNYAITYVPGTLTVIPADGIVLTATSFTRVYGEENPEWTYNSLGAELTGEPALSCEANILSPVGEYPIVITKGNVANYNDRYVNGTLTIVPATLTVTANDASKKQGEALPELTASITGFKNGEDASVLSVQPTCSTSVTEATEPGTYEITVSGAEAQNYAFTYVAGTLTVNPADRVVVTAVNATRIYGDENPEFTFTSEGAPLVGMPAFTCEATPTSPVGEYPIVITKGGVANYNDHYVNGTLTIVKAPLTVTANDAFKQQGDANPELTCSYDGFKNGETAEVLTKQPTLTTDVVESTEPGEYDIHVSGAEAVNYDITFVDGKFTVISADPIKLTATSFTRVYGEENPEFTFTSEGATLIGMPDITCEATINSPVGVYPILISKGSVANYNDSYVSGTLTITPAPLTVSVVGEYERNEGEENPDFKLSFSGWKLGEDESVLTQVPVATTDANEKSKAGVYDVVPAGGVATNYEFIYQGSKLTVIKMVELAITSMGGGKVIFDELELQQVSQSFHFNVRKEVTLTFQAYETFHLEQLTVNEDDAMSRLQDNQLVLGTLSEDTYIFANFVSNYTEADTAVVTVQIEGYGAVVIDGKTMVDKEDTVRVAKGRDYIVQMVPEEGQRLGRFSVNQVPVTDKVAANKFVLANVQGDSLISVVFVDDLDIFTKTDVAYGVIENGVDLDLVKVMAQPSGYEGVVNISETVVDEKGKVWRVVGVDNTAFRDCPYLESVTLPSSLREELTGIDLFQRCPRLAAIVWNAEFELKRQYLGSLNNNNLLCFVKDAKYAPKTISNVIVDGHADRIRLNGDRSQNFYCPIPFEAEVIEYTRNFSHETKKGICKGWETIALPFDVDKILNGKGEELTPFQTFNEGKEFDEWKSRPFWLYKYTEADAWQAVSSMQANTPYIISMPNDPSYIEDFRLSGTISFMAANATVKSSEELNPVYGSKRSFHPTFLEQRLNDSYVLNEYEVYLGNPEGSVFVRDLREHRPFEAYFLTTGGASKEYFGLFEDVADGLPQIEDLQSQRQSQSEHIYDLSGRPVNKPTSKGLYIQNGRKVLFR